MSDGFEVFIFLYNWELLSCFVTDANRRVASRSSSRELQRRKVALKSEVVLEVASETEVILEGALQFVHVESDLRVILLSDVVT